MQFILIDQITELNEDSDITAIKALSIAEEYLRDHFPLFPVMPGVLMLEGLFQASAWLVRQSENFSNSMIMSIAYFWWSRFPFIPSVTSERIIA